MKKNRKLVISISCQIIFILMYIHLCTVYRSLLFVPTAKIAPELLVTFHVLLTMFNIKVLNRWYKIQLFKKLLEHIFQAPK